MASAAAATIVSRLPRNRIGWLLLAQAALAAAFAADAWAFRGPGVRALRASSWAAWVSNFAWVPFLALPTLLLLWFPTGRPPTARWRRAERALLGSLAALLLLSMLDPASGHHLVANPVWSGAPSWVPSVRDALTATVAIGGSSLAIPSAVIRWRRSSGESRQQLRWFASTMPVFVICFFAPLPQPARDLVGGLGFAVLATTIAIAVMRYRLYDLDLVVTRAIVYAVSTVVIGAVYAAVVVALSRVLGREVELVMATFAVAIVFAPVRSVVQRSVDTLLFGDRAKPSVAHARLSRRLDAAGHPHDILQAALDDIRLALRAPFVELAADGEATITSGTRPRWSDAVTQAVVHRSADVGRLTVASRGPGATFGDRELRLLGDLGRQLGTALHALRLTDDLQRSRDQLVIAREAERHPSIATSTTASVHPWARPSLRSMPSAAPSGRR